ncbi:hypothetical protein [[Collinsella] massiliensis]|uniref:DUF697 domain-containing protein n=1 Tax=[Collinsella] massiliensis TaxID=1232426 RepID=A0A1Y3XTT3_9ACTN|nr:hypothetical protein [[Collinsella] massiliensis]OUN88925.1 hypothetical protein B5G02_03960 [[Collinsella] massiliensis]
MRVPVESLAGALKAGVGAKRATDEPVRVAVYVDRSASPAIVACVRDALVPRTTSALVRVERLTAAPVAPRPDTDIVLVLSCGSDILERAVHELVVAGAPVAVIAESSVEVPFIKDDTPLLGLIAATDDAYLLDTLARWILDRTEKDVAFAANFAFMRIAASMRIISSAAVANLATGALSFMPGADFPVMTITEVGMALKLSAIFGYRLEPERGYEVAGVLAGALALRFVARAVGRRAGHAAFIVKAGIAAAGTYGMGRALSAAYERGIDYAPLNAFTSELGRRLGALFGAAGGRDATRSATAAPVVAQDR